MGAVLRVQRGEFTFGYHIKYTLNMTLSCNIASCCVSWAVIMLCASWAVHSNNSQFSVCVYAGNVFLSQMLWPLLRPGGAPSELPQVLGCLVNLHQRK